MGCALVAILPFSAIAGPITRMPVPIEDATNFPVETSMTSSGGIKTYDKNIILTAANTTNNTWNDVVYAENLFGVHTNIIHYDMLVYIMLPNGAGAPVCSKDGIVTFTPKDYFPEADVAVYGKAVKNSSGTYNVSGIHCGINVM